MDSEAQDRAFMQQALDLAGRGRGRVEPNPMVGAVLVRGGRVIAEGYHGRFGGPHAEVAALQAARAHGRVAEGATLYCTLEPCSHHGKTPPCAPAVVDAGIGRAVLATHDPQWAAQAAEGERRGVEVLRRAGIRTEVGLLGDEAVVLNAAFFKRSRTGLPLVIAKWAMSVDGKIATRTGASRWISCEESRHLVHQLRGRVDAVVVGGSTAGLDDPLLTCREAEKLRTAARVVLCGSRAPAPQSRLVQSCGEGPVVLAHVADRPPPGLGELEARGCELLPLPGAEGRAGHVCPRALLRALAGRGASNVLVEGGREALGSFFDSGLVDRVMVFVAPIVLGGAEAVTAVGGTGAETVAAATGLLGRLRTGEGHAEEGLTAHTCVRRAGRDVLIEGWTSDPLQWRPRGAARETGES